MTQQEQEYKVIEEEIQFCFLSERKNISLCTKIIQQKLSELRKPSEESEPIGRTDEELAVLTKRIYCVMDDYMKFDENNTFINPEEVATEIAKLLSSSLPAKYPPFNEQCIRDIIFDAFQKTGIKNVNEVRIVGLSSLADFTVEMIKELKKVCLPSSRSLENDVNMELLDALKKLYKSASKSNFEANSDLDNTLCETMDAISNAEKQMNL